MRRHLLLVPAALFSATLIARSGSAACLVTLPGNPPFIPRAPYAASVPDGFWYGTDALWIRLPLELRAGQGQKLFVFSQEYRDPAREQHPALVVTGRRLDGDSPPFISQYSTNALKVAGGPAMLIGIAVPTSGCWELTGYYRGHTLTFIASVEP